MILSFSLDGTPAPQGSKRYLGQRGGKGITVESSKRTAPWRADVRAAATEAVLATNADPAPDRYAQTLWDGPIAVYIIFRFARPKSHYGTGRNADVIKESAPYYHCQPAFGLGVEAYDGWRQLRRHRIFESDLPLWSMPCRHEGGTIGLYGDHARDRRRINGGAKGKDFPDRDKLQLGRDAMGMPWAGRWREISEAIPPAYTEWIGTQLLAHLGVSA